MAFFKETDLLQIEKFERDVNMSFDRWTYCMILRYEQPIGISFTSVRSKVNSICLDARFAGYNTRSCIANIY